MINWVGNNDVFLFTSCLQRSDRQTHKPSELIYKIALCYGQQHSIINTSESCAKPLSLGCNSSCYRYFVQLCVLNQSKGYWLLSHTFIITIPLICQMWVESLTPDFSETQVFDGELKILKVHMLKQVIVILEPFFSFMLFFQPHEIHRMLAFMLDPRYKELRLVIDYVGKE